VERRRKATFDIVYGGITFLHGEHEQVTEPQLYSICAAVSVGTELDMTTSAVDKGIRSIKPVSGRMQHLNGLSGSLILDDTYNASPEAMIGALDTLYRMNADQKIAILGNMNELGEYSEREHRRIGEYCDPHELSFWRQLVQMPINIWRRRQLPEAVWSNLSITRLMPVNS
jgi:UDP-N-acetylmuramyl pentapeptide synthase